MMGISHATSGVTVALGWTALSLPLAPTGIAGTVAFGTITAGAALLPDLDHPSGTAAQSWGPASGIASRLVVGVCGPHRHGAHSILTAITCGIAAASSSTVGGWIGAGTQTVALNTGWTWLAITGEIVRVALPTIIVFLSASLAIGVLWRSRGPGNELLAAALALAVWGGQIGTGWLGIAIGLGCLVHIAGDHLTPQPMALWWPFTGRMIPSRGLFTTDTRTEGFVRFALQATNVALVVVLVRGDLDGITLPGPVQQAWPAVRDGLRAATGFG